jgi:hypothetical protein
VLEAVMDGRHRKGERVETPDLKVAYRAPADSGFMRGPVATAED